VRIRIFWRAAALSWLLGPMAGYAAPGGAGNVDAARLAGADNVHACLIEQSWIAYRAQESAPAHK
jgi:hypothetical protein